MSSNKLHFETTKFVKIINFLTKNVYKIDKSNSFTQNRGDYLSTVISSNSEKSFFMKRNFVKIPND